MISVHHIVALSADTEAEAEQAVEAFETRGYLENREMRRVRRDAKGNETHYRRLSLHTDVDDATQLGVGEA